MVTGGKTARFIFFNKIFLLDKMTYHGCLCCGFLGFSLLCYVCLLHGCLDHGCCLCCRCLYDYQIRAKDTWNSAVQSRAVQNHAVHAAQFIVQCNVFQNNLTNLEICNILEKRQHNTLLQMHWLVCRFLKLRH